MTAYRIAANARSPASIAFVPPVSGRFNAPLAKLLKLKACVRCVRCVRFWAQNAKNIGRTAHTYPVLIMFQKRHFPTDSFKTGHIGHIGHKCGGCWGTCVSGFCRTGPPDTESMCEFSPMPCVNLVMQPIRERFCDNFTRLTCSLKNRTQRYFYIDFWLSGRG